VVLLLWLLQVQQKKLIDRAHCFQRGRLSG